MRRVDHAGKTVHVSLTKEQIEDAPDFERDHMQESSYDDRYGSYCGTFL